jgi:hypothetical protein
VSQHHAVTDRWILPTKKGYQPGIPFLIRSLDRNGLFGGRFRCGFRRCRFRRYFSHFLNGCFDHFRLLRWLRPTGEYRIRCRWLFIPIAIPTPTPTAISTAFAGAAIAPIVI